MTGNIQFPGNPYPNGHDIKDFRFFVVEESDGSVALQLRLVTKDYLQSQPATDNDSSDWTSKIVWENYGNCILSSVDWEYSGFKIAGTSNDFSVDILHGQTLHIDELEDSEDDLESHAFGIYLLGHDSCANHAISFIKNDDGSFNIDWNGKIALAYAGEDDYDYSFEAHIHNATFEGLVARSDVATFVFNPNK